MRAYTTEARVAAAQRGAQARHAARNAALRAGQLTYKGQPCAQGHSGERYTSNWACVSCRAERVAWSGAVRKLSLLAVLYPEEFDAMGWRQLAQKDEIRS